MTKTVDPIARFTDWFREAEKKEPALANAAALATADSRGRPSVRMVLLKDYGPEGFVFYTNLESRKGRELRENPYGSLCFHWKSLERQVRVAGPVVQVPDHVADAYFASRERGSQIGAWASKQSRPLEGALSLEKEVARYTAKFGLKPIPRPDFWSGFSVRPEIMEFWEHARFRLHKRLEYRLKDDEWTEQRLYP